MPYFLSAGSASIIVALVKGFTRVGNYPVLEARAAMRVTSMVAGLAIVLAACGGEKKAEDQSTTATPEQPAAERPRPPPPLVVALPTT